MHVLHHDYFYRSLFLVQEVVRQMLVTRKIQKRKLKRHLQRHATEMGAARLTGAPLFFVLFYCIDPEAGISSGMFFFGFNC